MQLLKVGFRDFAWKVGQTKTQKFRKMKSEEVNRQESYIFWSGHVQVTFAALQSVRLCPFSQHHGDH